MIFKIKFILKIIISLLTLIFNTIIILNLLFDKSIFTEYEFFHTKRVSKT